MIIKSYYNSSKSSYLARKQNKLIIIVVFCFVLGTLIRMLYCIKYPVQPRDAYSYGIMISQWEETGKVEESSFFPLALWFLRIPHHFFQYDIIKGGVLINMILGVSVIIIVIKALSLYIKNNFSLLFAGLIVATHPMLVRYSCTCLRETPYLFFALLAISSLLLYCKENNVCRLLFAAIFGAIAFLCRLEGIEMVLFFYILLFYCFLLKRIKIRKALLHGFLFFVFFFFNNNPFLLLFRF